MFVLLTYDVNKRRVSKVMKVCRKYLIHVQNSVFEGEITESKLKSLKHELNQVLNVYEDSICIYQFNNRYDILKEQIGLIMENINII